MTQSTTQSAINRSIGKHQVEEQRASILDAAEYLFLKNGLENTSMVEIARQANISKVTLYRYFANRDVIALEIQIRMLTKISDTTTPSEPKPPLAKVKFSAQSMIRNFDQLRDAFRYIGMFDKIYLDNSSETALTQWTLNQLSTSGWKRSKKDDQPASPQASEISVILSTVVWFLEKLAMRGEITWSDKDIPLDHHLEIFEEMIMSYIDQISGKIESSS